MTGRPTFTVAIEEEYLIVASQTRDLVGRPDPAFLARLTETVGEQVTPEYLQCQVEAGAGVHRAIPDAVAELITLRRGVAEAAAAFG
jgi:carboxylate-amine ligase